MVKRLMDFDSQEQTQFVRRKIALRIIFVYITVAMFYVVSANFLIELFTKDPGLIAQIRVYLGWVCVLLSAVILYFAINDLNSSDQSQGETPDTGEVGADKSLQRQLEEMTVLHAVATAGAEASSEDALIERATDVIGETLYPDNFGILLHDESARKLKFHHSYRGITEESKRHSFSAGEGVTGSVLMTGEPVRVSDTRSDKMYIALEAGMKSELCVPMCIGERVIGVINAESKQRNAFNADDERLLLILAGQLATAIEKVRLLEAEKDRRREAETLRRGTSALTSTLDLHEVLDRMLTALGEVLPFDSASVFLREGSILKIAASRGFSNPEEVTSVEHSLDEPLYQEIVKTGKPLVLQDADTDKRFETWIGGVRIRGWMGIPLIVRDQVFGYMTVDSHSIGTYDETHAALAQAFVNQAAVAIDNARLFESSQRQALELSGLYETSLALHGLYPTDELLDRLYEQVQLLLSPDMFGVFYHIPEDDKVLVTLAMEKGQRLDDVIGLKLTMEEAGLTAWIIRERRSLLVYNMLENHLPVEPIHVGDPALSWLGVPLLVRDRLIGAISVQSYEPNAFNEADKRFVESLAAQVAISLENARLYEQTSRRLKQLQALRSIDIAITASVDLGVTLDILLDQVTKQLNIDAAAVWLFNSAEQRLHLAASRGFRTNALERLIFRPGDGLVGRAVLERDPVYIPDLSMVMQEYPTYTELLEEGFVAYYGLPLIAKGQVKGVLEVYHRNPIASDAEWLDFLETVATEAAIAVDNADLFNDLQRSNLELNLMYDRTLESWARAIELRGWENDGHTQRVVDMTLDLARDLGIDGDALINIRRGAYLHDFGNMQIPDTILFKADSLSDEEWAVIRMHPVFAYEHLSLIPNLRPAMDIPYCHHEKWDGSGYPRGIKEEQVPIAARIFAVVDVWDVLRSDRPYRKAWQDRKAIEYIKEQSGSHFDPNVVEAFLKYIRVRGFT